MRFRGSDSQQLAWGLADQAIASATTFGLTIVAARNLGPAGLGTVAIGYTAFILALGINRALVVDPLVTLGDERLSERSAPLACAVTFSAAACALSSCLLLGVASATAGAFRAAMLAFAPWIAPGVLLAMLRAVAFRKRRGSLAALGSTVSLAGFAVVAGIGLRGSPGELVAAWGLGATAGSLALVAALGVRTATLSSAARWVRTEALSLGRWLGATTVIGATLSYVLVLALTALVGAAAIGGYRAIESAFSGFSLVAGSIANPGIASLQAADRRSPLAARQLAIRLSAFAAIATAGYGALIGAGHDIVLRVIGQSFRPYVTLILPIAVGQTLLAASLGFRVLLKVRRRGKDFFVAGATGASCSSILGIWLGATRGIDGAAWGIAIGSAVYLLLAVLACAASERDRLRRLAEPLLQTEN
jgi:O-antigen/teichoic acid export membrane protein